MLDNNIIMQKLDFTENSDSIYTKTTNSNAFENAYLQVEKDEDKIAYKNIKNYFNILKEKNSEFKFIFYILISNILIVSIEFLSSIFIGFSEIICDGFFNFFKMISIFIILISILFTNFYKEFNYKNLNNIFFSIERIELVSSLGIIVFLIISNLYMLIEGLHKIIEKDEEVNIPLNLYKFICIFKIILNLCSVIYFNKYIIHPFYCKSMQINYWDNHKENMNVLCINLLGEILYCSLFLIYFYNFNVKYFGIYYIIIGFIYLIFNIMCIKPIFVSTTDIFMESKGNYFDKENNLKNQLSELFNEDDVKINSLKMRLNSQNNVVCYLKIKSKLNIDRNQIREDIQKFILEKYLHTINLVIQIDNIL